jgi:hypothetical protein
MSAIGGASPIPQVNPGTARTISEFAVRRSQGNFIYNLCLEGYSTVTFAKRLYL